MPLPALCLPRHVHGHQLHGFHYVCKSLRIHCTRRLLGLSSATERLPDDFKRHLVFNDRGELLDFVLTPGNVNPHFRTYGQLFSEDKGFSSVRGTLVRVR
jgi:hypothetical protein